MQKSEEVFNHLLCCVIYDGEWGLVEIPPETMRLKMGKDDEKCDFVLDHIDADDIQVVIQKIDHSWYIIERGPNDLMKVNGFPKRQIHLKQNQTAVIQIGSKTFIFATHQLSDPREGNTTPLQENQYALSFNDLRMNFNLDQGCLIGSNAMCDFHLPGEEFSAIISNFGKRFFLSNFSDTVLLESDVDSTNEHVPLSNGSFIKVADAEIKFELSKDLSFTQNFNFVPTEKDDCMKFMEIDADGNAGDSYVFPPTGQTITIGRSSIQCNIGISNNTLISRLHAQGIIYKKNLILADNNTTNGTFVNNKRIKKRKCFPGDIVRFGDVKFILCFVE